jgi:transketolase
MRNAFAQELVEIAKNDPEIVLLSGDIGNRLFDPFKKNCPNRFFNCGVAEANMASVAAGLAMCGFKPITYTITPFNTTRCLEQIRVDICYHNLPVIIVGTGAGLSYANLGCTHHSCEDISFLRSLPNMTVLCPGDAFELRSLLREAVGQPGPVYLRIGKTKEPLIYSEVPKLTIGKGHLLLRGANTCILSTGNVLPIAMQTAQEIGAQLVSFHTVKPLDTLLLKELSEEFPLICTVEEHSLIGGLGSAVAEWWVDQNITTSRLLRLGTQDEFPHRIGSQQYVRDYFGLNVPTLKKRIEHANTRCHPCRDEPATRH